MDSLDEKTNEVDITITAPSDNELNGESSGEEDEQNSDYENETLEHSTASVDKESDTSLLEDNKRPQNASDSGEDELCERFDSGVSLNEEKPASERQESDEKGSQNYEIVGDRVLVERDGKFELVDANEIKAEYFEMLGIKPEATPQDNEGHQKGNGLVEEITQSSEESVMPKQRPKTTPAFGTRRKEGKIASQHQKQRVQSSWGERYRSSEYANIKSPYGLSEKQLEIKKKREEAIARRKKEEEERRKEEEKQRREDAERAFQVS